MKITTILIFICKIIITCSPPMNFNYVSLEEMINYAGVIFEGTVTYVSDPLNYAVVSFKDINYYRGCFNNNTINVDGFKG